MYGGYYDRFENVLRRYFDGVDDIEKAALKGTDFLTAKF